MLQALEVDALDLLRRKGLTAPGVNARLQARAYLLSQGWTVEQVNAAQAAPQTSA
jgi:hypothetical protein